MTELEGAVLGALQRDGPSTAYAIKELFRASPSDFWSGSAGSIYPLMRRLEARGMVAAREGTTGRRGHRTYRVTPGGRRAFRRWLLDAERAAGMGFDPLRTRMLYLDQLSPEARARFRAEVLDALDTLVHSAATAAPELKALHRIWCRARKNAFASSLAALETK